MQEEVGNKDGNAEETDSYQKWPCIYTETDVFCERCAGIDEQRPKNRSHCSCENDSSNHSGAVFLREHITRRKTPLVSASATYAEECRGDEQQHKPTVDNRNQAQQYRYP